MERQDSNASIVLVPGASSGFGQAIAIDPGFSMAYAGLALTYASFRSGPSLALRAAKARPVVREEAPELHRLLDEVCVSAGLTTRPKLYLVDDPVPNAFATGLSLEDSHVAVTTGLVERLPRYELRAVLAHEVAHIVNDDIRAVTVAVATAGALAFDAYVDNAKDAIQVLGGIGFTWEHDAHLYLRRAVALRQLFRGPHRWRAELARAAVARTRRHLTLD